jgi:septum formation protein
VTEPFVYLASKSPRRQELLRQIGVRFELLVPGDDEDAEALEALRAGESPTRYVQRVTLAKAEAARERLSRRALAPAPILVSDTTVAIGGTILGKPADAADAARLLRRLSGRTHRVLSAVAVVRGRRIETALNVSRVVFARLPPGWIDAYVASGEPMDKAGAYAIQGDAARYVRRIDGSHSGIMGLPLYETSRLLRGAGQGLATPPSSPR